MNIRQLNTVLCLSAVCIATSGVAIAKDLKMTEKNIQECTSLLNNVAASDKKIHEEMQIRQARATQNSALLSANNPIKPFNLATTPPIQAALPKPAAPVVTSPQNKTPLPPNTQVFASDDPKAIDHLTGKNTTPLMATPDYSLPKTSTSRSVAPKALKPSSTKPKSNASTNKTAKSHPRIQLFAPNGETVDLNHLEGKSADVDELKKSKKTVSETPSKASPEKTGTTKSAAENTKKADDTKVASENAQKTAPEKTPKIDATKAADTVKKADDAKKAEPENSQKTDNAKAMSEKSEKVSDAVIKSSI